MDGAHRYGLAFVQNYTVLGSLRIVGLGCLFVPAIFALAPPSANSSFMLGHFAVSTVIAFALGYCDGPKRLALFEARPDRYEFVGEWFYRIRINLFVYSAGLAFYRAVVRVAAESGELAWASLVLVLMAATTFVPPLFVAGFSYPGYSFFLFIVMVTTFRVVRAIYWRATVSPKIEQRYGYTFRDLYRTTRQA